MEVMLLVRDLLGWELTGGTLAFLFDGVHPIFEFYR